MASAIYPNYENELNDYGEEYESPVQQWSNPPEQPTHTHGSHPIEKQPKPKSSRHPPRQFAEQYPEQYGQYGEQYGGQYPGQYLGQYPPPNVQQAARPAAQIDPAADEPELQRHRNGHRFDAFWTDNFPPEGGGPSAAEGYMARCGCSCCLGPCCSDVRKDDWKRLFLTFTFWTVIVELIMLIIEFVLGGISWPSLGPDIKTLINLGGKYLPYIYCKGHAFRYITPVVLHSGLLHYLFNALFTYRVMLPREVYWGLIRTALMYVVCGIGGSVLSLALYRDSVSVGASGALCGIFGGYMVDVGRMWMKMNNSYRYAHGFNIVVYLVIMVVLGFTTEGIDNGAHLGGLLTGICFGMIILQKNIAIRIVGGIGWAVTWILPTALLYTLVKIECSDY